MNGLRVLLALSRIEGLSLVTLLLIAMPLKYMCGMPVAVRLVGSIHGALFLSLLIAIQREYLNDSLAAGLLRRVAVWSLVPFGFLVVDRPLRVAVLASMRP